MNTIRINVRPISEPLAKKAATELNEDPKQIGFHLHRLRQWLLDQPHLRTPLNDQFLVAFLRGSKYNLDVAKRKLDLFFTIRETIPELMKNRDPLQKLNLEILNLGTILPLPKPLGVAGPRVHIIRCASYDPHVYDIHDIIKVTTMFTDIMTIEDDNFIIGGSVGIMDLKDAVQTHFFQINVLSDLMKKMTRLNLEAQPFEMIGFHYINVPEAFEAIFNLIKGFMSDDYKNKFYVHPTIDTLYNFVPRQMLPFEYGGPPTCTVIELTELWTAKVLSYRDLILEWEHYGVNERIRMRPPLVAPPPPFSLQHNSRLSVLASTLPSNSSICGNFDEINDLKNETSDNIKCSNNNSNNDSDSNNNNKNNDSNNSPPPSSTINSNNSSNNNRFNSLDMSIDSGNSVINIED